MDRRMICPNKTASVHFDSKSFGELFCYDLSLVKSAFAVTLSGERHRDDQRVSIDPRVQKSAEKKLFGSERNSWDGLECDDLRLKRTGIRPDRRREIIKMAIALPAHCSGAGSRGRKNKSALPARGFAARVNFGGSPAGSAGISIGDTLNIRPANGAGTGSNNGKERVERCVEHECSVGAILICFWH